MTTKAWLLIQGVVLVVVSGASWLLVDTARSARDEAVAVAEADRDQAVVDLAAAELGRDAEREVLAEIEHAGMVARADHSVLAQAVDWHRRELFLLGLSVAANEAEQAQVEEEALEGFGEIILTEDSIAAAQQDIAVREAQAEILRRCLTGVTSARDAVAVNDHATAAARLSQVRDICQEADRVVKGIDTLFPFDFPDPYVLVHQGRYWAYATNAAGGDVQTLTSSDGVNWSLVPSALPALPSWASGNRTWAPSVLAHDGRFILFYTVRSTAHANECISAAAGTSPAGPFVDLSSEPLICEWWVNGSIDPSPYVDGDGRIYLTWKSGDVIAGHTATLWSRELELVDVSGQSSGGAAAGRAGPTTTTTTLPPATTTLPPTTTTVPPTTTTLPATTTTTSTTTTTEPPPPAHPAGLRWVGDARPVLTPSMSWDVGQIEGPGFVRVNGQLWLLYSAHWWDQAAYSIGKARCETPLGPCYQDPVPLMQTVGWRSGPGGPEVFVDPFGQLRIAYHSWVGVDVAYPHRRVLHVDRLVPTTGNSLAIVID